MTGEVPWSVLLLGGASGVGKTNVSYRLAREYGVALTEIDDFQVVLEGMTTPEQYPVLHYWRTNFAEARAMNEEEQLHYMLSYSAIMARALTLVIANHIETCTPLVLEGDFLLPSLAVQARYDEVDAGGQVRAVFLYEPDEEQLARNYKAREGREQPERARASWRHSEWLRAEAERVGVPTVPARPWDSVLDRVMAAVDGSGDVPQ